MKRYEHREYFTPKSIGETREHSRKRVMKGIRGCRPASHVERAARRIGRGAQWQR
jgi:hypothetical protein